MRQILTLTKYNPQHLQMIGFKKSSPVSVSSTLGSDRIPQGKGRRIDCERELKKIMKDANHAITSSHPTMEGALLGSDLIPFEVIPELVNPGDFVEKIKDKLHDYAKSQRGI
jgi:hypothetical protein